MYAVMMSSVMVTFRCVEAIICRVIERPMIITICYNQALLQTITVKLCYRLLHRGAVLRLIRITASLSPPSRPILGIL